MNTENNNETQEPIDGLQPSGQGEGCVDPAHTPQKEYSKSKSVMMTNPCIDSVFQYGFLEPSILSDFLNAVLSFTGENAIEEITYLPKDLAASDPLSSFAYHFTVDIRCRTKNNHHFLIEMQNDFWDDYHLKCLVEHSRMLSRLDTDQSLEDQALRIEKNKGDTNKFWKNIEGLYTIVITNKAFSSDRMKSSYPGEAMMEPFLVNNYELRHTEQLERRYGDTPNQIVLLMLDNLNKKAEELSSSLERWAYLFKDPSLKSGVSKISETKEISDPDLVSGGNKSIRAFIDRVNIEHLPQEVRERYIRSLVYFNDTILDITIKSREEGEQVGIAKGEQIGIAKGEQIGIAKSEQKLLEEKRKHEEEKNHMAYMMFQEGMDIEKISRITGLSIEEIQSLKSPGI
jgi:predicted transposase/invertase (TIGR01784 family)